MTTRAPDEVVLTIPAEIEAEEAFLGSLFIEPEALHDVSYFLSPDHFYRISNGWIYQSIIDLDAKRLPLDIVTISSDLTAKEQLEEIGGQAYLIGLINSVPTSVNIESYAHLIVGAYKRRMLIRAAERVAKHAHDAELSPDEAINKAEEEIYQVSISESGRQATKPINSVASEYMDSIEELHEKGKSPLIPTGYGDLDKILAGGFERGSLVLIAADTSMGKSSLVREIMFNAAKADHSGAIFTLEMPVRQYFQRQVSSDSGIPLMSLKGGKLMEHDWEMFYRTVGKLSMLPIDLDDSRLTPALLLSKGRRIKMRRGLDIVAVDLMHQMDVEDRYATETQRLAILSRRCKQIAMELDAVMIVVMQLNTKQIASRQNKRPNMADVRNSSDPNGDADVVLLLYRDDYYNPDSSARPNIAEVAIEKNRDLPVGLVDLYWNGPVMSFRNLMRKEIAL